MHTHTVLTTVIVYVRRGPLAVCVPGRNPAYRYDVHALYAEQFYLMIQGTVLEP